MDDHEIDRLAAAMNAARPDWPLRSLRTFIGGKLSARPYRDAFVALAWVASESATASPARVLEAGPWWRAAAVEGQAQMREPFDAALWCSRCGQPRHRCETNPNSGHDFESVVDARRRRSTRRAV